MSEGSTKRRSALFGSLKDKFRSGNLKPKRTLSRASSSASSQDFSRRRLSFPRGESGTSSATVSRSGSLHRSRRTDGPATPGSSVSWPAPQPASQVRARQNEQDLSPDSMPVAVASAPEANKTNRSRDGLDVPEAPGHFRESGDGAGLSLPALHLPFLFGNDKEEHEQDTESPSARDTDEVSYTHDPAVAGSFATDKVHDRPPQDYFSYPKRVSHYVGTKSPEESDEKEDFHDDPETWSLVSADHSTAATAANGAPELNKNSHTPYSIQHTMKELEEAELKSFLQNFSRHTREVKLLGSTSRISRMPQWSDFAYSSDEDVDEDDDDGPGHYIARHNDRPVRSRLLTHIDRGLQQLHPSDVDGNAADSAYTSPSSPWQSRSHSPAPSRRRDGTMTPLDEPHKRRSRSPAPTDHEHVAARHALPQLNGRSLEHAESPGWISPEAPAHESKSRKHARIASQPEEIRIDPKDENVDGVAFCIAYILATVEQLAPDDLDDAPITEYRESRARSHIERLYIIAPFWEQLAAKLQALYRWENPRVTAAAAMIYFVLWYTDLLPTAFLLTLMYYVAQFRYMPQDESYLHQKVIERMSRGQDANRLAERLKRRSRLDILDVYKRWQNAYGRSSQVYASDVADFHEKVKNLLLWRNPVACKRTLLMLGCLTIWVSVVSPATLFRSLLFLTGFDFFALMPLQSHYPRYRRPLSPLWWFVLGSPTDAQRAVHILRMRHERAQKEIARNGSADMARLGRGLSPNCALTTDIPGQGKNNACVGSLLLPDSTDPPSNGASPGEGTPPSHEKKKKKKKKKNKLGSFFCQYRGVPGHMQVTATHLYFSPLHVVGPLGSRSCYTPLDTITGMRKVQSIRLWLWSSSGLQISRHGKGTLLFSNMSHRDDAFNLLLTLRSENWLKV